MSDSIIWRLIIRVGQRNGLSGSTVRSARGLVKVALASNRGFRSYELTVIRDLVLENRDWFLERWNAYFSGQQ
jgi:hypothetical protein